MSMTPYAGSQLPATNGTVVPAAAVQQAPQASTVATLTEWAHGAVAAREVAVSLVNTSFCPAHYRGKPDEATAAILSGLEVGLQPMASLQAFNPIQGNAAPKAITLRAIVLSKGHTLDLVESSATRAVVVGRRNGTGPAQTSTWTIERATVAGLPKKNPNWHSQPEAMLIARATSEGARLTAADAILGIPYSYEELADGVGPVQATAEQVAPPSAAPARRRNPSRVIPEETPAVAELPAAEEPGSTRLDPKGEVLAELLNLLGQRFAERGDAVAFVAEVVGRPVAHPKDLTHAEARRVIERLREREVERTVGPPEVDADDAAGAGS